MWMPSQILSIYAKTGSTNPVRLLVRFGSWLNAQNKETGLSYRPWRSVLLPCLT